MAICPRCHHNDNDNKVANRICKLCYRDLVLGVKATRTTQSNPSEDAVTK